MSEQPSEPPFAAKGRRLEMARTHWQYGAWEEIAALSTEEISADPDRAKLMALIAGAQASLGQLEAAKIAARQVCDWGCDRSILTRVLLSAVHNSLAVAALGLEETETARSHFLKAIELVEPRADIGLLARTREIRQAARAGLLPDAVTALDDTLKRVQARPEEMDARLGILQADVSLVRSELALLLNRKQLRRRIGKSSQHGVHTGSYALDMPDATAPVIVIGSMRHSGSTALFNIVRLGYIAAGIDPMASYSEVEDYVAQVRNASVPAIIKTHEFRDDVIELASVVLTAKRDLRDTVASAVRRDFFLLKKMGSSREYAKYNRMLYDIWAPFSDYEFCYERYRSDPVSTVSEVLKLLGLPLAHAGSIVQQVETLPVDQYPTTLLSPTHITDPERRLNYTKTLSPEDVISITQDHLTWLEANEYPGMP